MAVDILGPKQALNKAFLKIKPLRSDIEKFKTNVKILLDQVHESESEEFHKNLISDFLKITYYHPDFFINTKDRKDLVIHNGKDARASAGVIIEAKNPSNRQEMAQKGKLNTKALQELIFYYLQERFKEKNIEIKHLIITNVYEWFIFDANIFEKLISADKGLLKKFKSFDGGSLSGRTTDFFYSEIAKPFIDSVQNQISFTYFNLKEYEKALRNSDKKDDNKFIALFKLFSPQHLLKLPFKNDNNSLDRSFYSELLHIIGLTEIKKTGKKLIQREEQSNRSQGALIESAIVQLDTMGKIYRLQTPYKYGESFQEKLFNVALELSITWINRVLFLKLLEAQIINYHNGNKEYAFMTIEKIKDYDDLNTLFFSVLARRPNERNEDVKNQFGKVPYLNSSLFEPTELEQRTISISNLRDDKKLSIVSSTILKDRKGKKKKGEITAIEYLFQFLDAYDFSSEGAEKIQEDNKALINASVLGLIFEKINGYKDGSFFTPGFITMYMCKDTLRKAVIQKFNRVKNWNCSSFEDLREDLHEYIKIHPEGRKTPRKEANEIINSIKICDPAVGSGHFLVSALNELIAIKYDLGIFQDRDGKKITEYSVTVVNDELIVTRDSDDENLFFEYRPSNKESQCIQETLFHEKQGLIENCLFGVDINSNSVKICRLRLWIELLKSAYYTAESRFSELETLPNIDINIKCGNSLISRYPLDSDLKEALKKSKLSINAYKKAVHTYQNAESKDQKREMEALIAEIKSNFQSEITKNDPRVKRLARLKGAQIDLVKQLELFERTKAEEKERKKKLEKLEKEIAQIENTIEEIKSNRIYENAFEWRFEFPEVLNDNGEFEGFDVVVGNPPYIRQEAIKNQKPYLKSNFITYTGTSDLYVFFVERGFQILTKTGCFCYIMPNKWMQAGYGKPLRAFFLENRLEKIIDFGDLQVFEEATTYPCILSAINKPCGDDAAFDSAPVKTLLFKDGFENYVKSINNQMKICELSDATWIVSSGPDQKLLSKLNSYCVSLADYVDGKSFRGVVTGLTEAFIIGEGIKENLLSTDPKNLDLLKPVLRGRTIKKWYTNQDNLWLIGTFPVLDINIDKYPAIKDYFFTFGEKRLEQSGSKGSRKKTGNKWFEIQDNIAYWREFEKNKIMYQVFQVKPCFIYDDQGLYCNNSMWIIPKDDKVLLAILNSKIGWWLISQYCTAIQNGYQLIWQYFGRIPIPKILDEQKELRERITDLADRIIEAKKGNPGADTTSAENKIDQLVYQLYGLDDEEIQLIEGK
ncbi:Eco57I restriction-modification methylase domain-containing protein [Desulfobacula sp.]|uniref:class I SAM-dependent DNA methyltransferase n=1 Tax=Desulfobacula sp. TaxID=2593537 RepID=UPI0025BC10E4|nr:Eco57I restriction-modification methylase domain-containing protein [Desulfobacula sp.]MBC2705013.1 class I SAM-dependent DNA methyltransferase [Desulfobacula sp.]